MTYILLASTVCFAVLYVYTGHRLDEARATIRDLYRALWAATLASEPDSPTLRSVSPPPSRDLSETPGPLP